MRHGGEAPSLPRQRGLRAGEGGSYMTRIWRGDPNVSHREGLVRGKWLRDVDRARAAGSRRSTVSPGTAAGPAGGGRVWAGAGVLQAWGREEAHRLGAQGGRGEEMGGEEECGRAALRRIRRRKLVDCPRQSGPPSFFHRDESFDGPLLDTTASSSPHLHCPPPQPSPSPSRFSRLSAPRNRSPRPRPQRELPRTILLSLRLDSSPAMR